MMRQMAFSFVQLDANLVLGTVVHTALQPTEDEWLIYLAAVRQVDLTRLRTVVFTDGGGPNSAQRKAVNDFLQGRQTPVVLVSTNPVVRGITTALSWFNPLVKSVAPEDVEEAFRYLKLPQHHRMRALQEARKLRAELQHADVKSVPR